VWADICTVSVPCAVGMGHAGTMSARIGICGAATITTIISMGATSGFGVHTDALVSTGTDCELCTGTTKDTGVVCDLTGTCGDATTTTSGLDGSG